MADSLREALIAEYERVKHSTTDTYTAREYAGLALSCGVDGEVGVYDRPRDIEVNDLLRRVREDEPRPGHLAV